MRSRFGLAMLASILSAVQSEGATVWRKPSAVAAFGARVPVELHRLVKEEGRKRVNHFCAVVKISSSAARKDDPAQLLVYWREGARISTYGEPYPDQKGLGYRDEGADINLRMDVVAHEKDIDGSIKRVTRAYVQNLISHCTANGTRYLIGRPR